MMIPACVRRYRGAAHWRRHAMAMSTAMSLGTLACLGQSTAAHAESAERPAFHVVGGNLQKRANGVLALMGYSAVPDLSASSLSIRNGTTDNPSLSMTQFGGGFTISKSMPLYLEGAIGGSRYDPTFVVSDGAERRRVEGHRAGPITNRKRRRDCRAESLRPGGVHGSIARFIPM